MSIFEQEFEVFFQGSRGICLTQITRSKERFKLVVPDKSDWANDKNKVGHVVKIKKITHDTQPEISNKGVLFVTTECIDNCPVCKKEKEKQKLPDLEAKSKELEKLVDELRLKMAEIDANYSKFKEDYLGEYVKEATFVAEFALKRIPSFTLPEAKEELGSVSYQFHHYNNYSKWWFEKHITVGKSRVYGGTMPSEDEMGTRDWYYNKIDTRVEQTWENDFPEEIKGYISNFNEIIEVFKENKKKIDDCNEYGNIRTQKLLELQLTEEYRLRDQVTKEFYHIHSEYEKLRKEIDILKYGY